MLHDVELEVHDVDESGDPNGTPYFLQTEVIAVALEREGPPDMNLYSAGCLP